MNNVQSYVTILKTANDIDTIKDIVENRLIITKSGKIYYDYSENERIELTGGRVPYLYDDSFECIPIHNIIISKYEDINETDNLNPVKHIITPCLIFDKFGNYGVIIEAEDTVQKCKILILGVITDYIRKDFAKEINNQVVGGVVVNTCCDEQTQMEIIRINPLTSDVSKKIIKLIGEGALKISTDVCKCDLKDEDTEVEGSEIRVKLNVSEEKDNVVEIRKDGIYVPGFSEKIRFEGPYDTIDDIPKPYKCSNIYLIGTKAPYMWYVRVNCEWIPIGASALFDKDDYYNKAEIDEMLRKLQQKD